MIWSENRCWCLASLVSRPSQVVLGHDLISNILWIRIRLESNSLTLSNVYYRFTETNFTFRWNLKKMPEKKKGDVLWSGRLRINLQDESERRYIKLIRRTTILKITYIKITLVLGLLKFSLLTSSCCLIPNHFALKTEIPSTGFRMKSMRSWVKSEVIRNFLSLKTVTTFRWNNSLR